MSGKWAAGKRRPRQARDANDLSAIIGRSLRILRVRQGLSLDQLAKLSGVSRAMLSQIETAKSVPTINVLWKAAVALGVSLADLLPATASPPLLIRRSEFTASLSPHGSSRRALYQLDAKPKIRVFEICLDPSHDEPSEGAPFGTKATLVVASGTIKISIASEPPLALEEGDAILFEADQPYSVLNIGRTKAVLYLVLSVGEPFIGLGRAR